MVLKGIYDDLIYMSIQKEAIVLRNNQLSVELFIDTSKAKGTYKIFILDTPEHLIFESILCKNIIGTEKAVLGFLRTLLIFNGGTQKPISLGYARDKQNRWKIILRHIPLSRKINSEDLLQLILEFERFHRKVAPKLFELVKYFNLEYTDAIELTPTLLEEIRKLLGKES